MKKKSFTLPALAVGLLLSATACTQSSSPAADTPVTATTTVSAPAAQTHPLTGAWRMETLEFADGDNMETVPFSGQIIFTENGSVSVQAQNPDTEAPDTAYTVQGYEAFYGPATIDSPASTFTVTVESAAARDLIGQQLTRNYEVTGDTLVLTPVDASEGWRVTYERQTQ